METETEIDRDRKTKMTKMDRKTERQIERERERQKYTEADVVVIGLIGERAREVGTMVNELFEDDSSQKITVVAVPADRSPLMRIRGANRATAIAEYFRDQGKNVLLIMDSLNSNRK